MNLQDFAAVVGGRLIVSAQAYPGEPLRTPDTMARMAQACQEGGAAAVRVQGLGDIRETVRRVSVPVIGLVKDGKEGVFITPTLQHAIDVAEAGAQVVALDGTRRPRPDGLSLQETIAALRERSDALIMADCGSVADAEHSLAAGADLIGTTLAGYTGEREATQGPDLELLRELAAHPGLNAPIVAEGRYHSPADAAAAIESGALTVVVGTAITHPTTITSWFAQAVAGASRP